MYELFMTHFTQEDDVQNLWLNQLETVEQEQELYGIYNAV
jgi:hypothetical protein